MIRFIAPTILFVALASLLALSTTPVQAQDALTSSRIIKLEQDVRNLEQQVGDLSRQLAGLQQARPATQRIPSAPVSSSAAPDSAAWLDANSWKHVRTGMSELEVISLLGPPTTLRGAPASDSRTLLYALEIGSSGFLSGSVMMKDGRVTQIQIPTLR